MAGAPGTDVAALRDAVAAEVGPEGAAPLGEVLTGEELRDRRAEGSATVVLALRTAVGAFAALAVAVAVVVVSNTWSVLLAQRVREQALLRCVGATRRDLWRAGTTEAALLGAVSGLVGLLAGWGVALAVHAVVADRVPGQGVGLPLPDAVELVGAPLLGVVAAVVASVAALVRAGQVSPLAALRPVEAVQETARTSVLRTVLGGLLVLGGGAGTVAGALLGTVLLALPAAVAAFVGVLVLGRLLLPAVARLLGQGARLVGGPAGALAAASVGRHPRRTAATASAVLIGVTLAVTAAVGAASLRATTTAEIEAFTPVDVTVTAPALGARGHGGPGRPTWARSTAWTSPRPGRSLRAELAPVTADGSPPPVTSGTAGPRGRAGGRGPDRGRPAGRRHGRAVGRRGRAPGRRHGRPGRRAAEARRRRRGAAARPSPAVLTVVVDADTPVDVRLSPGTAQALEATPVVLVALVDGLDRDEVAAAVDAVTAAVLAADPDAVVDSPALLLGLAAADLRRPARGGRRDAGRDGGHRPGRGDEHPVAVAGRAGPGERPAAGARPEPGAAAGHGRLGGPGARASSARSSAWCSGCGFGVAGTWSLLGGPAETVLAVPWPWLVGLVALVAAVAVGASLLPAHRASAAAPAGALGATG